MKNLLYITIKSIFVSKKIENKVINRTISDMETDGMYFSPEIREELKNKVNELNCEYSGLPSVMSYMDR